MKQLTKIVGFFFVVAGWLCPFVGAGESKPAASGPTGTSADAKVTEDSPIYLRHGSAERSRYLDMNNAKDEDRAVQHWNHYSGHCSGHCNHWSHHSHCNGW